MSGTVFAFVVYIYVYLIKKDCAVKIHLQTYAGNFVVVGLLKGIGLNYC